MDFDANGRLSPSEEAAQSSAFLRDFAVRIKRNRHGEISRLAREGREARLKEEKRRREQQQATAMSAASSSRRSNDSRGDGTAKTPNEFSRLGIEHQQTDATVPSLIPTAGEERDGVTIHPALPQAHTGSEWENTPAVALLKRGRGERHQRTY